MGTSGPRLPLPRKLRLGLSVETPGRPKEGGQGHGKGVLQAELGRGAWEGSPLPTTAVRGRGGLATGGERLGLAPVRLVEEALPGGGGHTGPRGQPPHARAPRPPATVTDGSNSNLALVLGFC